MKIEKENEQQANDTVCCNILLKMGIGWFSLEDGRKCIPYIGIYRVNYCPSCGKNIRGLILEK